MIEYAFPSPPAYTISHTAGYLPQPNFGVSNSYGHGVGAGVSFCAPPSYGMTLRDYFAAQALVGMLAHNHADYPKYWAEKAYSFADDMMKARGGG